MRIRKYFYIGFTIVSIFLLFGFIRIENLHVYRANELLNSRHQLSSDQIEQDNVKVRVKQINKKTNFLVDDESTSNFKCYLPTLIFNNSVALKYLAESKESLKKTFDSCKVNEFYEIYEINDYTVINKSLIKQKLSGNHSNYYEIKLKQQEFSRKFDLKSLKNVECKLSRFDKLINASESYNRLEMYETYEFKREFDFKLYVQEHGFYSISCFLSGLKNNTKIYEDVLFILPQRMSILKEERKKFITYEDKLRNSINGTNDSIIFTNEKIKNRIDNKMNVLLMKIDAVSKNHFKRIFPLTYSYLKNELEGNIFFENFNSVGSKYA
jgi:hypothetical protein